MSKTLEVDPYSTDSRNLDHVDQGQQRFWSRCWHIYTTKG